MIVLGSKVTILKESHHYIQGVAWDPCEDCLATLGTDRYRHSVCVCVIFLYIPFNRALRIYKLQNDKFRCAYNISKLNEVSHVIVT